MSLFSMEGRYSRAKYFWTVFGLSAVSFVSGGCIGYVGLYTDFYPEALMKLSTAIGIGIGVLTAFQAVKRLHDLNRSGFHFWLLFIPFYNLYLALVLFFSKGTLGANPYGTDPLGVPQAMAFAPIVETKRIYSCTGCANTIPEENLKDGEMFCPRCGSSLALE